MNVELIRRRLEAVKDAIMLNPSRFDQRFLVGTYPCVGCIAAWLDYMMHGEEHWNHGPEQVRQTAVRMIGSDSPYPALFWNDVQFEPGTFEHVEAACKKIDAYLENLQPVEEHVLSVR